MKTQKFARSEASAKKRHITIRPFPEDGFRLPSMQSLSNPYARQGKIAVVAGMYSGLSGFSGKTMFFPKVDATYESEATKFIAELKEKNPQLEQQQRDGRALLWDKAPIDMDKTAREQDSRVVQQPYVYQNH